MHNGTAEKFVWAEGLSYEKNINVAFLYGPVAVGRIRLEVCGLNAYRVFCGGKFVGYGPARAAHGYVRRDVFDLSDCLGAYIAVEVTGYNVNSYCCADVPPAFSAAVCDGDGGLIADTDDFKCFLLGDRVQRVQRYSFQRPFAECYRAERCRTSLYNGDAAGFKPLATAILTNPPRVLERNAPYPDYARAPLNNVYECGSVKIDDAAEPWRDRSLMNVDNAGTKGFLYGELDVRLSDEAGKFVYKKCGDYSSDLAAGRYVVFDAGRTRTGFLELGLDVKSDCSLYVIFDEIDWKEKPSGPDSNGAANICFYRNDCCNVIKYELKRGGYRLMNFEPFSARFLKLAVLSGEARVKSAAFIDLQNGSGGGFKFECGDIRLNAIAAAAAETWAQNAVDIPMDCPSRERAGWLCDAMFSSRAERLLTGANVIERNFLENYALCPPLKELPAGMVPMCYPADAADGVFIPNWAMWYVLQLADYYRRAGERSIIDLSRSKVYGLIDYFDRFLCAEGLLSDLDGWIFIEWSKANDFTNGVNFPTNMLYGAMLKAAGELYGDNALIKRGEKITELVRALSFNGEFFEDNAVRLDDRLVRAGNTSETCQYYAFYFDIASPESFPGLFAKLFDGGFGGGRDEKTFCPSVYKSNAFIGDYMRLDLLCRYGRHAQTIKECADTLYNMAVRTGTLWEHNYVFASLNHGFASYALNLITRATAGFVRYESKDSKIVMTEPQLKIDLHAVLPVGPDRVVFDFNGPRRTITFPKGFKIEYV
ncbi:MAG: hypothetical protein LBP26_03170 [Clostridiales bacterium]|jgi:alpha-L-rhamnosidase|nr:hypothetical protein [Clostridiales bacterium]